MWTPSCASFQTFSEEIRKVWGLELMFWCLYKLFSCDKGTSQWLISPLTSGPGPNSATGTLRLCALLSCMVWLTIKKNCFPILYVLPDLHPEEDIMPSPIQLPAASLGATMPLVPHFSELCHGLATIGWKDGHFYHCGPTLKRWHTLCPCLKSKVVWA